MMYMIVIVEFTPMTPHNHLVFMWTFGQARQSLLEFLSGQQFCPAFYSGHMLEALIALRMSVSARLDSEFMTQCSFKWILLQLSFYSTPFPFISTFHSVSSLNPRGEALLLSKGQRISDINYGITML